MPFAASERLPTSSCILKTGCLGHVCYSFVTPIGPFRNHKYVTYYSPQSWGSRSLRRGTAQLVYHFVGMPKLPGLRYKLSSAASSDGWYPSKINGETRLFPMFDHVITASSSQQQVEPQFEATVGWMKSAATKTVLCVDDEKLGLRVRQIMLEGHGFKVLTATSGEQGLALIEKNPVDLVVLDYYMPGMNGGDVAAELRRRYPKIPIIFLSAYFSLPPAALELANAFITKGDPPEVLIEGLEKLI
jgi:CheY-like chemotaxis protein